MGQKEKLLETNNFSFSCSVFYPSGELLCHFHRIWNRRLQTLSICKSLKFVVWERINPFRHNDTFWRLWERSLLKTLWEKEKLLLEAISPFPTMFSTLSKTEIINFLTFNLSSANAFNLDSSKILSFGKELRTGIWDFVIIFQVFHDGVILFMVKNLFIHFFWERVKDRYLGFCDYFSSFSQWCHSFHGQKPLHPLFLGKG